MAAVPEPQVITLMPMTDFLDLLAHDGGDAVRSEGKVETGGDGVADVEDGGERLMRVAFECLASGLDDARVASLLRVLGFDGDFPCFSIAGRPAATVEETKRRIRQAVRDLGGNGPLIGVHDGVVAALIRMEAAVSPDVTCTTASGAFDVTDIPLCLGPMRHGVSGAAATLRAVLTTVEASPAFAPLPTHDGDGDGADAHEGGAKVGGGAAAARMKASAKNTDNSSKAPAKTLPVSKRPPAPLRAEDALPERALLGDEDARRELVDVVYASLAGDGQDDTTMLTVSTFLASGGSLETTARTLNVHPNTVRYRLKRAADTTGWDAANPREAYVLMTAIALGRIAGAPRR